MSLLGKDEKGKRGVQKAERRMEWANSTVRQEGRNKYKRESNWKEEVHVEHNRDRAEDREEEEPATITRHGGSVEILEGDHRIRINGEPVPLKSFRELSSAVEECLRKEYQAPTMIQKYCIRSIIEGRDVICRAPTGMGKTMCFLIPMIENYRPQGRPQACVISPTRELCEQIRVESMKLVVGTRIRVVSVYGKKQDLPSYAGVDIVVATPGRLVDLLNRGRMDFSGIKMFVLDEADKLLDMGFEAPIREIHSFVPKESQTCLFSATYSPKLSRMINHVLPGPKVSVEIVSETLKNIKQEIVDVGNKKTALLNILQAKDINLKGSWRAETQPDKILVFVERKSECGELERFLKKNGVSCVTLHGDKEQADRNDALKGFRDGAYPVMVATSVAARGIDVKDIKIVVNYDIPKDIKEYIHRIGRTGREGKTGKSVSFFDSNVTKEVRVALLEVLRESKNHVPGFLTNSADDFNDRLARLKIVADKDVSDNEEVGLW